MTSLQMLPAVRARQRDRSRVFLRDVGHGLLEVSHNTLALLGLAVVVTLVFVAGRADLRHADRGWALGWLQDAARTRAERDRQPAGRLRPSPTR